jgi:hypothetical protein
VLIRQVSEGRRIEHVRTDGDILGSHRSVNRALTREPREVPCLQALLAIQLASD